MAVSALTVLLSNTLEESQFVAAPAQRKRLILEGPLAALQGGADSEDEAAGAGRGGEGHVARGTPLHAGARHPPFPCCPTPPPRTRWPPRWTPSSAASLLPQPVPPASRRSRRRLAGGPGGRRALQHPSFLSLFRLPPAAPAADSLAAQVDAELCSIPPSSACSACLLPLPPQTRWRPRWTPSSRPTCPRWRARPTPSSPAASACCRAWGRLRAWCGGVVLTGSEQGTEWRAGCGGACNSDGPHAQQRVGAQLADHLSSSPWRPPSCCCSGAQHGPAAPPALPPCRCACCSA